MDELFGSELFGSEVFRNHALRLQRVAEARLASDLRSKVSPEDVVQSAFKSFFRRLHAFRFEDNQTDGIWALLLIITIRKCHKWEEFYRATKRDVAREKLQFSHGGTTTADDLIEPQPGPEEVIAVTDLIEQLICRFNPRQQEMLLLRIQGFELDDIAQKCQSSRRTVTRVIAEAKLELQSILDAAESIAK